MARVESTRPPGVRSVKTTSAAPAAIGAIDRVDHVFGGDRMDDAVDDGGEHNRPALAFARGVLASERGLNCQRQAEGQEQKRD